MVVKPSGGPLNTTRLLRQFAYIPGRPVFLGRPRRPFFSALLGTSTVRVGFGASLPTGTSVRPTVISSSVGLRTREVDCA